MGTGERREKFTIDGGPGIFDLAYGLFKTGDKCKTIFTVILRDKEDNSWGAQREDEFYILGIELHEGSAAEKYKFKIKAICFEGLVTYHEYKRTPVTIIYNIKTRKGTLSID